jgi:uncharacterized protein YlaN (UPF0358 family)
MPLSTIFQLYRAGSVRQFHCIADYNVALEGTHHYKLRKEIDWSVVMKMFDDDDGDVDASIVLKELSCMFVVVAY